MPSSQKGGCFCKKTRYELTGNPEFSIQCYCRDCQHMSGGGHMPAFAINRENFNISGPVKTHQSRSDSGNDLEFVFCSACGSPIYKTTTLKPELIFICAGSLDDPAEFSIEMKVYEDRRQPWDES